MSRSEADAARFKAQAEASAEGERGDLVSLEAQIDALQRRLEEEKNGVGVKLMDEATRAAQLADQLQLTQRTANKPPSRWRVPQAPTISTPSGARHLQLKAAQEKIKLPSSATRRRVRPDERVKAAMELTTAPREGTREARAAELEAELRETETRLELEVAGSLAAAKREAIAARPQLRSERCTRGAFCSDEEENRDALADAAAAADDGADDELDVFLPPVPAGGLLGTGSGCFGFLLRRRARDVRGGVRAFARGALADLDTLGVAAGVRHGARAALLVQQRHNGDGVGVAGGAGFAAGLRRAGGR